MNNRIIVVQNEREIEVKNFEGINVEWLGCNSILKIHMPCSFNNSTIQLGTNCVVSVDSNSNVKNLFLRCAADDSKVVIGKHFNIEGGQFILAKGGKKQSLVIGDNCLFSSGIFIQTSDGHTIIDDKGKVINNVGGDIFIGEHCWLGHGVSVLKKAHIPRDCIVAESAVVTKSFTRTNCILGGVPAKIIKIEVNWDIKSPLIYMNERLKK